MEIKIQSLDQIHEAAHRFVEAMGDNTVFAFYGNGDRLLHHKEFLTCNICTVLFQGFLSTCDILLLY
jgi:hypothetical protein